jgi:hypothetical protein
MKIKGIFEVLNFVSIMELWNDGIVGFLKGYYPFLILSPRRLRH